MKREVIICDVCQKEISGLDGITGNFDYNLSKHLPPIWFDICEDCVEVFLKVLSRP